MVAVLRALELLFGGGVGKQGCDDQECVPCDQLLLALTGPELMLLQQRRRRSVRGGQKLWRCTQGRTGHEARFQAGRTGAQGLASG